MTTTVTQELTQLNKQAAVSAAVFETGRLANKKIIDLVKNHIPASLINYMDTPLGKLALANAVLIAVQQFKPDSKNLEKIANGMVVAAYQELIQQYDIQGMLETLSSDTKINNAIKKLAKAERG